MESASHLGFRLRGRRGFKGSGFGDLRVEGLGIFTAAVATPIWVVVKFRIPFGYPKY